MIGKLMCLVGLHRWKVTELFGGLLNNRSETYRTCSRCQIQQQRKNDFVLGVPCYVWTAATAETRLTTRAKSWHGDL